MNKERIVKITKKKKAKQRTEVIGQEDSFIITKRVDKKGKLTLDVEATGSRKIRRKKKE